MRTPFRSNANHSDSAGEMLQRAALDVKTVIPSIRRVLIAGLYFDLL